MKRLLIAVFATLLSLSAIAAPSMSEVEQVIRSRDFPRAERMLSEVLREHPDSAKAHYFQAQVEDHLGRTARAKEELVRARQLDPSGGFASADKLAAFEHRLGVSGAVPGAKSAAAHPQKSGSSSLWIWLIVIVAALGGLWWWNSRRQAREAEKKRDATRQEALGEVLPLLDDLHRVELEVKTMEVEPQQKQALLNAVSQLRERTVNYIESAKKADLLPERPEAVAREVRAGIEAVRRGQLPPPPNQPRADQVEPEAPMRPMAEQVHAQAAPVQQTVVVEQRGGGITEMIAGAVIAESLFHHDRPRHDEERPRHHDDTQNDEFDFGPGGGDSGGSFDFGSDGDSGGDSGGGDSDGW